MNRSISSARALLWVNLPFYLGFGLCALFASDWLAGQLEITLGSPTAFADFRAMYGGLSIGVGLIMVAGLYRRDWLLPVVALAGICALELAVARAYSWMVSGMPSAVIIAFLATELVGFV